MANFDEKVELINQYIKANKDTSSVDIIKSLFDITHLKNSYFFNLFKQNRLKGTEFSSLSQNELFGKFTKPSFYDIPEKKIELMFQEVYNRTMVENDSKPRYIISFSSCGPNIMGYIENSTNSLVINSDMFEQPGVNSNYNEAISKDNIGTHLLLTILHETRHNLQNDKTLDFVLDEKQSEDDKAMSAINLMYLALGNHYIKTNDKLYFNRLNYDYTELFYEHDANYFAINKLDSSIKMTSLDNREALQNFIENSVFFSKRELNETDKEIKKSINTRADKMCDCLQKYYQDFVDNIEDCPLKEKIVNTVSEFIKTDSKKDSKFRAKIVKEMNFMVDEYKNAKKSVNTNSEEAVATF